MKYYNKFHKYLGKYTNIFGGDNKKLPNASIDLILYYISLYEGGSVENVLKVINTEYVKLKNTNYKLGVKPIIENSKINFEFVIHDTKIPPSLGYGNFSAIYELKNKYNKLDTTRYILRLFNREPTYYMDKTNPESNKFHMCEKKKIKEEYGFFSKYLLNIYYYGVFNVLETGKVRTTKLDYLITKMYNSSSTVKIAEFNQEQKYKFLENNIKMLLDFRNNNRFLGDYKLTNIGWDDDLNIILIDYDSDTIITIDDRVFNNKMVYKQYRILSFKYSYLPNYLIEKPDSSLVKNLDNTKYDKFSICGLINVIEELKLKVDLIQMFKLNDVLYENILTYEEMLKNLELQKNNL